MLNETEGGLLDSSMSARIRLVANRYFRRHADTMPIMNSLSLARRLEYMVPQDCRGPATRAILQSMIDELAPPHTNR